ncbi:hypothetical protein Y032_0002g1118 [Ancylostoma ceylanicum]|nr:hypothetical protein Y032_0002g1118 [Ancylostoma ceylanicum]
MKSHGGTKNPNLSLNPQLTGQKWKSHNDSSGTNQRPRTDGYVAWLATDAVEPSTLSVRSEPLTTAPHTPRPRRGTILNPPPKQKIVPRRHTTEISSANTRQERSDPDLETAKVLEDLDTILDEELSFEERRNRIEAIPLHPYPPDAFDQAEEEQFSSQQQQKAIERARAQSRNRHSTPVPVLNDSIIEDLRSVTHGADISAINETRKAMAIKLFKETESKIEEVKQRYTPEYFKVKKFTGPGIPPWKSDLLAKRYSSDFIRHYEEKAWREFSEWKKVNAPSVDLHPPYEFEFHRQPML